MNDEDLDKHIEIVVEEVVDEIGIQIDETEKKQITHHVIFVIHLIILVWSFLKCCNNVKNVEEAESN